MRNRYVYYVALQCLLYDKLTASQLVDRRAARCRYGRIRIGIRQRHLINVNVESNPSNVDSA